MYETFEHTADLGLRAVAADRNTLFAEMAAALFSTLIEDLDTVQPIREVRVELTGEDCELLLFDWLKELLYRFDAEHLLCCRFSVVVHERGLEGSAWGEPLDPARHTLGHEVKAITYHGLKVQPVPEGWLAEVIVDI